MKTSKLIILMVICLCSWGCLDFSPKTPVVDANLEARLEAKMENRLSLEAKLNNQIGAQGNVLDTKISALETKLTTQIQQSIGKVTGGQVNTGSFSGGALYVTVVCIFIIICITGYMFWVSRQWKAAYQIAKDVIQDKSVLHAKMDERGLSKLK